MLKDFAVQIVSVVIDLTGASLPDSPIASPIASSVVSPGASPRRRCYRHPHTEPLAAPNPFVR